MATSLDDIMNQASGALAGMDYLTAETLCLQALGEARAQANWAYYARILMPLQEARRQRRIMAAEGILRLGTADLSSPVEAWLELAPTGCVALTQPHTADDARRLHDTARQRRLHVEVLHIASDTDAATWRLHSFHDPKVMCDFPAPPAAWREQWLRADQPPPAAPPRTTAGPIKAPTTPADWFLAASEALGDAALARLSPSQRTDVSVLERLLDVAPDHEILHQTLARAARECARQAVN